MKRILLFLIILAPVVQTTTAHRGRYQSGSVVYKRKMWRCAMWWRRLGDISKSDGTRLRRGTDLALELGKMNKLEFKRWLINPSSIHPKVNCNPGPFHSEREIDDLLYYFHRRANNPPKKPILKPKPLRRTRIRLYRTMKRMRERLKTIKKISKWRGRK
ncbi:MAG: hypothetical protein PF689_12415 [Deltaproteobacteria bacterium]|jgi:hypothetical protein|nr:hypothetical protein [Deltaproteobacteria bacterium]